MMWCPGEEEVHADIGKMSAPSCPPKRQGIMPSSLTFTHSMLGHMCVAAWC